MASSTGIYIGTENVDIVSVSGSFQKPRLASFARAKLPHQITWRSRVRVEGQPGSETAFSAKPEESLVTCIQTLVDKLGLSTQAVQAGLPSESVVIRYFQMPAIPQHERKMAIAFEAKKYLPFKLEELVTDFQVVIRRGDPTLMRVMFFGIKRSSSYMYSELFQSSGLQALGLEPAPLSLMRLLRCNGRMKQDDVAVLLLLEQDTATISIARSDLLYLSRNITITPQGSAAAEEPSPELIEALVNETRVSMDYYRRRFLGEPAVTRVILFGQQIDPKRLKEISQALELPVQRGDPFETMGVGSSAPPGLAVAAGLALRGLEKRSSEVNLLAPEHRLQTGGLMKPFLIEAAACAAALAVWYGVSVADLNSWRQQIAFLQGQQVRPAEIVQATAIEELQRLQASRHQELHLLRAFADKKSSRPSVLLAELSRLLPDEAWLRYTLLKEVPQQDPQGQGTLVADSRRLMRLWGSVFADNRDRELERVNHFLGALRQNKLFSSTYSEFSLDSMQRSRFGEEEVMEFHMSCASHPEDLALDDDRAGRRRQRR